MVMACVFNPSPGWQRQVDLCEFEAGLIYRTSSRTARATERNLVLKNKKQNKTSQSSCKAHDFCYSLGGVSLEGSYIRKVGHMVVLGDGMEPLRVLLGGPCIAEEVAPVKD